jgi:hypothetical protein
MNKIPVTNTPRAPTEHELKGLTAWDMQQGLDKETAEELVQSAYVAVFDQYQSDGPVYAGKIMMVVWSGMPSVFNVFAWHDGKMEEEVHDLLADRVH